MNMVAIKHNLKNPYSTYGLNHFLNKYGIPSRIGRDGRADIEIICNNTEKYSSSARILIRTSLTKVQHEIMGYLRIKDETLPLFDIPRKLNIDGEVMATFHGDDDSYPCVIVNGNCMEMGFDIFGEIGYILSGHLEAIFKEPGDESDKLMKVPVVDALEKLLFAFLEPLCRQRGINIGGKSFWPDGKKFAVCLTHDVDRVYKTYQYIPSILQRFRKGDFLGVAGQVKSLLFSHGKNNPYWVFDKIISLENELQVKSTFYFLNETGRLNPFSLKSWILFWGRYKIDSSNIVEIIKKLHSDGFEVGVHGSYYSYNDVSLLRSEKTKLEKILDDRVYGIRQHYLNIDQLTPKIQESEGFEYDTTLGFRKGTGFRRGTCFPYHPLDYDLNKCRSLLEIPLIVMDGAIPGDEAIFDQCIEIMDIVEKNNGLFTLLWHQRRFSETDFPFMTEAYKRLVTEAINRNAWVATAKEIYQWYCKIDHSISDTVGERNGTG